MPNVLSRWLKTKSGEATLADIEGALERLAREQAEAVERHEAATRQIEVLTLTGADDAALDDAERRQKLAEREVARCAAARPELLAAHAKLQAAEKAELRRRLRQELVEAGEAHIKTMRPARSTAARYIAARYALERHGFAVDAGASPFLPLSLIDLSEARTPNPNLDSSLETDMFEHNLAKAKQAFAREVAP